MRVLVVDDQKRTRQSLKVLLKTLPGTVEVEEAINGREAVQLAPDLQPDLVLMDALMPEMDGVEATRQIKQICPRAKVIVLSMYSEYQSQAAQVGADAFVSKGDPAERLVATIATVLGLP